jgi:hypothetical protein
MKSVATLPIGYILDKEINLLKDKKLFLFVNIGSILLLIPFIIIAILFQFQFEFEMVTSVIILPMMIVTIIVHELIHAWFFKMGTTEKVKFGFHGFAASASVPGVYFYKQHYLKVGLSPAVLLNLLLILLIILLPKLWFFPLYLNLAIHFGGCIGDFYVSWILRKYTNDTLIEDTGIGMKFYVKDQIQTSE